MAFVRNPVVYVPDLTNGRPIVDGKVYLLTAGTVPPTQDSAINPADLLTVSYVNEAGNTVTQPQPLYTSKGGCLYGSFPEEARQYMIAPQEYVFAAYDRRGKLQYSAETTASDYVETDALAAVNSTVLVGGVEAGEIAESSNFSKSAAAISRLVQPSTSKQFGLYRLDQNNYYVWRPLGGQYWQRWLLNRSGTGIPFNLNEMYIKQVFGYICAQDAGVTYTGGWATTNATSALSSASATSYISGRARQAIAAGDYVEITYNGGGDLFVIFTGKNNGNFVNVLLDGKKDYLTLQDDGSGNKYFDSYTATDLTFKQVVRIAQGVPVGAHTIRLTVSASKNPSSAGNRFIFNALSFDSNDVGPFIAAADAPLWKTGEAVLQNQVRKSNGRYYYAVADGTTGATAPTHASGTVSDGSVSWTQRNESGYDLLDHQIQAIGSQLEYAYQIKPVGATVREDVGGSLHGNETQTSFQFQVGNNNVSPVDFEWRSGDSVCIRESITATHSEIGGGATPVVLTTLKRNFTYRGVEIEHNHRLQMQAELGYFYSHMWPLLHYSGLGQKYGIRRIWSPSDGYKDCADYYGQVNPFVGDSKDSLMIAYGDCMQPNGVGGVPSVAAPPLSFAAWLSVDPYSVDFYSESGDDNAFKAMNTSGANVSAGGFSSMTSKMYFTRYSSAQPISKPSGYEIDCRAVYGFALIGR